MVRLRQVAFRGVKVCPRRPGAWLSGGEYRISVSCKGSETQFLKKKKKKKKRTSSLLMRVFNPRMVLRRAD